MTKQKRKDNDVLRSIYAVYLPATGIAEAVNTHINITALYAAGAETSAHLILVGGVDGLTLIYAVVC